MLERWGLVRKGPWVYDRSRGLLKAAGTGVYLMGEIMMEGNE